MQQFNLSSAAKKRVRVAFIAIGVSEQVLDRNEFYRQDIEILRELGYEVVIINRLTAEFGGYDLAFVWWWTWLWLIGPALRRHKVPIIVTGTLDPLEFDRRPPWQKILIRWGCHYSDSNIFVSKYVLDGMNARFKVPRADTCPHIVTPEYTPDYNVRRDSNVIFNVAWRKRGNLIRKMQPELIDAFAIAKSWMPDLRLVLAGHPMDGEVLLRKKAHYLGIEKYVTFLGPISRVDKIAWMRSCGQYYQCSRSEGFGVAIAEAMGCAAAVVVNRKTAIPEVVGDSGFYVKNDAASSIAEMMIKVATDAAEATRIGRLAAERIDENFRMPVRREYFRKLIEKTIRRKLNTEK